MLHYILALPFMQFGIWQSRIKTLEEEEYPRYYYRTIGDGSEENELKSPVKTDISAKESVEPVEEQPQAGHVAYQENQRGMSYQTLFGPYLTGAQKITLTDPYIRLFYQARNLMEFLETIARIKPDEDEVSVHLVTVEDEFKGDQQEEYLGPRKK